MNSRSLPLIVLLLLVLAVALGWHLSSPPPPAKVLTKAAAAPAAARKETPSQPKPTNEPPHVMIMQPFANKPFIGKDDLRAITRRHALMRDPNADQKMPIEFYGLVVDEKEQPLAEALVECTWKWTDDQGQPQSKAKTLRSAVDGRFHLSGIRGKTLHLKVSKEGYLVQRPRVAGDYYEYADPSSHLYVEPDPKRPIVQRLTRRPEAEPTYAFKEEVVLPADTLEGKANLRVRPIIRPEEADLHFKIERSKDAGPNNRFDWKIRITGTYGSEFIITDEEFLLRAPEQGWQPDSMRAFQQLRAADWPKLKLYVRNSERRFYSALELEIMAYDSRRKDGAACIRMRTVTNMNNSPVVDHRPPTSEALATPPGPGTGPAEGGGS